jgi:iron-sulfur cluster repair protein YtfE (RIC family)
MPTLNFPSEESDIAENIIKEHDALRHKVHCIHSALYEQDPSPGEIEALLREFLNALVVHFANEEDDGFLRKVAAESPRLAKVAARLSIEHRELLREAEGLCRFAEAGAPSVTWWRELTSRCHAFNQRLMQHECEENRLLQKSHRTEINVL